MKDPLLSQRFSQPVSRLVMRVPRNSPAILVLAVTLAAAAAAVSSGSSASKIQTPDSKTSLVSYFAEWHGTAIASSNGANAAGGNFGESTTWEFSGSAIIHYGEDGPGFWTYRDSKFLNLVDSFELAQWQESGACNSYQAQTYTLLDSGLDDALIRLWTPNRALKADTRRVNLFFQTTYERGRLQKHWVQCGQAGNEVNQESPRPVVADVADAVNSPWDLIADKDDISSFSVHNQFKADLYGRQSDVDWSAHAYRLGKCVERSPGPISETDPIVYMEHVAMDPDTTKVSPTPPAGSNEGVVNLTVTVTCDNVPIQDAQIQVTVEPQDTSGGHNHPDENRPRGTINGKEVTKDGVPIKTDAKGMAKLKFEVPLTGSVDYAAYGTYKIGIGGIYKVTAKSKKFPAQTAQVPITATVDGLTSMQSGSNFVLVGATTDHPENVYATAGTIRAFVGLADDFAHFQVIHNAALVGCGQDAWSVTPVPISINDIALPMGGIFDIDDDWSPSHQTHNKGEGGDFNRFLDVPDNLKKSECDGKKDPVRGWLLHMLLGLAQPTYGKWDCKDLGHPPGCDQGKYPDSLNWIPHRLHLHVED